MSITMTTNVNKIGLNAEKEEKKHQPTLIIITNYEII